MEDVKCLGSQATEPRDAYKVAYIIHFILGAGNLLPWNTFITAVDYFSYLYPDKHVEKTFSVAYMAPSLAVLVLMMSWSNCRKLSHEVTMNLGFSMFVVSTMVPPVLDWAWKLSHSREDRAFSVMVTSVVICGLADGLVGGSLVGSAGKLPKQYMQAVFAGTASSGVLISILRITTKSSLPQTPQGLRTSAHFYFIVSSIILIFCILCSNFLYRLPVMQQHYKLVQDTDILCSRPRFCEVGKQIKWPALGILLIYIVTLSIFPGFIAEDLKSNFLGSWYPVLLITIYNVSDFAGKSLTAAHVWKSIKMATLACVARLLFYPLFAACLHGPKWLRTEAPMVVLTFMLGFTNGYLTSVVMILAPKSVPVSEAEIAAIFMAVCLGIGLASGSVLSWFWTI